MTYSQRLVNLLLGLAPVALALMLSTLVLIAAGAPPLEAYKHLLQGASESPAKIADVLVVWVPLALCSAGLLFTFTAGLWNIGVEGQIIFGVIFATWVARNLYLPAMLLIPLMIVAGMIGGALWGLLAGTLKVYGGVHEIFAGLGLNFIAITTNIWLIAKPWRPDLGATMQGTDPFPAAAWLPRLAGLRLSPVSLLLATMALVVVFFILRGTLWGLQLKAIGKNARSAYLLGIATNRHVLLSFALCGALAGVAGVVQVSGVWGRNIPQISGGIGYLSLLVAMLSGFRALGVAPVALFFAALGVGAARLHLRMQLDPSLAGVLGAGLVLSVLLVAGLRTRLLISREG